MGDGGRFKKEGTCVQLWLIHVDVWQKSNQYCKAIILQLKINKRTNKKKEIPYTLAIIPHSLHPPNPRDPLFCFLPLWVCLFWTFHINVITKYVVFCGWLHSFKITSLRFIHVAACISTSFLFMAK